MKTLSNVLRLSCEIMAQYKLVLTYLLIIIFGVKKTLENKIWSVVTWRKWQETDLDVLRTSRRYSNRLRHGEERPQTI